MFIIYIILSVYLIGVIMDLVCGRYMVGDMAIRYADEFNIANGGDFKKFIVKNTVFDKPRFYSYLSIGKAFRGLVTLFFYTIYIFSKKFRDKYYALHLMTVLVPGDMTFKLTQSVELLKSGKLNDDALMEIFNLTKEELDENKSKKVTQQERDDFFEMMGVDTPEWLNDEEEKEE